MGDDDGGVGNSFPGMAVAEAGALGVAMFSPLQPQFGSPIEQSAPPPAISGGTLLLSRDGARAYAADPDRDLVYVVDLASQAVTSTVSLAPGDEPGRLAEDGVGRVHVALRGAGALVTIDPSKGTVLARRPACPAPRGVTWEASSDRVWVACATGELVALPAAGGAAVASQVVERDLRDVLAIDGALTVTKFRSAQVVHLAADGTVARRDWLPSPQAAFLPHVAYRTVAAPGGRLVSVHQAETTQSLVTHVQGGYAGGCGGIGPFPGPPPPPPTPVGAQSTPLDSQDAGEVDAFVEDDAGPGNLFPTAPLTDGGSLEGGPAGGSGACAGHGALPGDFAVLGGMITGGPLGGCIAPESGAVMAVLTVLAADGSILVTRSFPGAVAVDVAVSADGSRIAVVAAGNVLVPGLATVFVFSSCGDAVASYVVEGQPIAVAFDAAGDVVVQTREPAGLTVLGADGQASFALSSVSRRDTGHDVFHAQAGALIACASCHPEGGDDGHVWLLDGERRRTPSLRGTIRGTAPYHWPGDMKDLTALVDDVYTVRMSGQQLSQPLHDDLRGWVEALPAPPAPSWIDPAAAQRGQALFSRTDVGCASCHSGPQLTDNATVDVGTGGAFQVPPLVGVGWPTPLLHDGCAQTLADRFGACGTAQHGSTASLSAGDVADLVAYLETL
jgi:DNA-binding beta-propeller fold protein YncE